MTFSYTKSSSFTIVQARLLSSKVSADMHLCVLYYGQPTEQQVHNYSEELAQLLNGGYVEEYEFDYNRDEKRVVCWRYTVQNGQLRRRAKELGYELTPAEGPPAEPAGKGGDAGRDGGSGVTLGRKGLLTPARRASAGKERLPFSGPTVN